MTLAEYDLVHDRAFSDTDYIANAVSAMSAHPDEKTWNEFRDLLPPGPLLEIGPGTGHLLAAARQAGREVYAIEASAVHRDFIARTWGIRTVYPSFEELPASAPVFAAGMSFNTVEHVYDVAALFGALRSRVAREGMVLTSTCNAECIILPIVGMYWAMFKPSDHVSIPAAEGLRRLAARTGFKCQRVWTGEYPLETPIGLGVAFRDWIHDHRPGGGVNLVDRASCQATQSASAVPLRRKLARGAMRLAQHVDPSRYVATQLGRAAAIRTLFAAASGPA